MIAGLIHWRTYVLIALGVAGLIFFLGSVTPIADQYIIPSVVSMGNRAVSVGMARPIADLIVQPVVAALDNGPIAALIAGILWPFIALWVLLLVLLFFFSVIGSSFDRAADTIR
jgi:hypothetical protein